MSSSGAYRNSLKDGHKDFLRAYLGTGSSLALDCRHQCDTHTSVMWCDVWVQALLTILDSPLNKAGKIKVGPHCCVQTRHAASILCQQQLPCLMAFSFDCVTAATSHH